MAGDRSEVDRRETGGGTGQGNSGGSVSIVTTQIDGAEIQLYISCMG